MTEEEKKRLALEIFQSTLNAHPLRGVDTTALSRMEKRQAVFASLAQQGITWQDLKKAYDEAFQRGQEEMLYFHMTFFYAASVIAYREWFPDSAPETVASFMRKLASVLDEADDYAALIRLCLDETGFDVASYDKPPVDVAGHLSRVNMSTHQRASRKDVAAITRMQRSGITETDLAYEQDAGYSNGWNSEFHYSACIAGLGIVLRRLCGFDADAIESFVEWVEEIIDSEICVADILSCCERETGIDVSRMT